MCQRQSQRQLFVREAQTCEDPVEKDFFNTGAVAGRTEFEYICSICGANPDESPLVSDAVPVLCLVSQSMVRSSCPSARTVTAWAWAESSAALAR